MCLNVNTTYPFLIYLEQRLLQKNRADNTPNKIADDLFDFM